MYKNYIVSTTQSQDQNSLTPCGKARVILTYASGQSFMLRFCQNQSCYQCRQQKLTDRFDSIELNTDCCKKCNLVTVQCGTVQSADNISTFETRWQEEARRKKLLFTFFASYELQHGLINIHYAMFTDPNTNINRLQSIIERKARHYFPNHITGKQIDITLFQSAMECLDYVSKRHWSNISEFAIPKTLKRIQCRWRRGYKQFFDQ